MFDAFYYEEVNNYELLCEVGMGIGVFLSSVLLLLLLILLFYLFVLLLFYSLLLLFY